VKTIRKGKSRTERNALKQGGRDSGESEGTTRQAVSKTSMSTEYGGGGGGELFDYKGFFGCHLRNPRPGSNKNRKIMMNEAANRSTKIYFANSYF
jgi:hypothetical protein